MGRKRRRRRSKNPIRRIFAFISKFIRNLQQPSFALKTRRRRKIRPSQSLISPVFKLGSKFLSNHQGTAIKFDKRSPDQVKKQKSPKQARLEIISHERNIKITRIQK